MIINKIVKRSIMTAVNFYSASFLDRSSELRTNFKYLQLALCKKDTKYIVFKRSRPLVESGNGKEKVLVKLSHDEVKEHFDFELRQGERWPPCLLYLGRTAENVDWFALNNTESDANEHFNSLLSDRREFADGYVEGLLISWKESSITAQAQSMFHWHDRYRFCPTCGSKMKIEEAGYKKTCLDTTCRSNKGIHNTSYPRTDPTVIMNVVSRDGRKCLLGRKAQWPEKMYSCLAGFMEPGESIEDAVARETKEESGIIVSDVKYTSSQPWPYPSTLMLGCQAKATTEEIHRNEEELQDVRWFEREIVEQALHRKSSELYLPPPETIAHQVIRHWLEKLRCSKDSSL